MQKMKYHRFYPWLIWMLAAGFFFAEYLARVAPSVMVPELMQSFRVHALSLGVLSAFFYYAYVIMQVPVGTLVDRFGPHRLLTVTAVLCALGSLLFAYSDALWTAELGRLLTGFGAAFAFVGTLKLATLWFPARRLGLLAGLTQALGMLGAAIGEGPLALAEQYLGWRMTMVWIAVILLIVGVFIGMIVRDRPTQHKLHIVEPPIGLWKSFVIVIKNRASWMNAIYIGLLYAPSAAFAELWGPTYLKNTHDLNPDIAATGISFLFIGWAIAGPFAGMLSDRMGRRKPVMLLSSVLSLITMTAVLYLPRLSAYDLFIILFCYGVSNTGVGVSYAVASEINPKKVAGTSIAFANMASVLIGAAFQPLIGWILDLNWHGKLVHGVAIYSVHAYHLAVIALPVTLALSGVVVFFIKETYCGQKMVKA